MENEEVKQVDSGAKDVGDATNYIEAIKEIKANSVDRRAYDKLMADNKALLDAIVNGKEVAAAAAVPQEPVNVQKLREELFSAEADFSNLDYVKKAVELRDALLEQEGVDCFCPIGKQISPTAQDAEAAQRLADGLKACIEYADGDSQLFTQELQRITKNDTGFIRRA